MEAAGGELPSQHDGKPYPKRPGKSLIGVLTNDDAVPRDYLWWFHDGHKAIRVGNIKAVAPKDEPWELYDLSNDRAESKNLAETMSGKAKQLAKRWDTITAEFSEIAK